MAFGIKRPEYKEPNRLEPKKNKEVPKPKKVEEKVETEVSEADIALAIIARGNRLNNIAAEIIAVSRDYGQSVEDITDEVGKILEAVQSKDNEEAD